MDRKEAISIIESLYPIDSPYEGSREIGEILLNQAKRECDDWRILPDNILFRYADLCMQKDEQSTAELLRKQKRR